MPKSNLISPLIWQGIPFEHENSWYDFLGYHYQWHQLISTVLPGAAVRDPVGGAPRLQLLDDLKEQGEAHQAMHDQIADRLGIPRGGDLASANLKEKNEFTNWMFVHALDHQRFRTVLGI